MENRPRDSDADRVVRARLAIERTLLAWAGTSASLIAAGFTVYQIFRYPSTTDQSPETIVSPQIFGIAMILVGVVTLTMAWLQHRRELNLIEGDVRPQSYSVAAVVAVLTTVLGLVALLAVALQL